MGQLKNMSHPDVVAKANPQPFGRRNYNTPDANNNVPSALHTQPLLILTPVLRAIPVLLVKTRKRRLAEAV